MGALSKAEFEDQRETLACRFCSVVGRLSCRVPEYDYEGGGVIVCEACGRLQFYCPKDRATARRPALKSGTIRQLWDAWGNVCGCCNMTAEELDLLGRTRTVQHVPRWKEVGEDGYLIPFCDSCNLYGEARHSERSTIIKRLRPLMALAAQVAQQRQAPDADPVDLGES